MTVDANIFIDDNFDDGDWTPQKAAQYLEASMNGDTAQADSIETPADTDADEVIDTPDDKDDAPATEAPTDEPKDTPSDDDVEGEKVVLARDGVHTIPYEKLVEARERDRVSQEALAAANAELEILRKQNQTPANAAPTQQEQDIETAQAAIDAGVNPDYFGDFSEEALAEGINKLIDERVQAQVNARVAEALKPMQAKEQESAEQAHMRTIYEAHQDADSVVESGEFESWKAGQPSYIQASINQVLNQGSADQVVELLNNYKQSTNSTATPAKAEDTPAAPTAAELKAKAREAIKNTAPAVPASLSDIPGGHKGATNITEQMDSMSGMELVETMMDWSPEKRNQYLNNL
ncbi:hypothetical protein [Psychrobacter sp. 4Bb]|uniref:hypothetical protein n=1 Tax=Psychrobacter sp. 4Bb TaxID=888436 RepID=UPI000C7D0163|nr:hypothetical protein [Psychrobacter sp. 4Bb]PKH81151.1 hypothetical protein CXF60_06200 [Psychrobacter sp. 4Bb]